jgi:hypothetical protein
VVCVSCALFSPPPLFCDMAPGSPLLSSALFSSALLCSRLLSCAPPHLSKVSLAEGFLKLKLIILPLDGPNAGCSKNSRKEGGQFGSDGRWVRQRRRQINGKAVDGRTGGRGTGGNGAASSEVRR